MARFVRVDSERRAAPVAALLHTGRPHPLTSFALRYMALLVVTSWLAVLLSPDRWLWLQGLLALVAAPAVFWPRPIVAAAQRACRRLLLRHRWAALARQLNAPDWWPRLLRVTSTPVGERLHLRLPVGASPADLERIVERVSVGLDVPETTAHRPAGSARRLELLLRTRDPLAVPFSDPWPALATLLDPDGSGWDPTVPVPVARTELGDLATVELWQSSLLLGGQPGAGKTAGAWLPVLAAISNPSVVVLGIDLKGGVELGRIASRLDALATSPDAAVELLDQVAAEVDRRLELLRSAGLEKVDPSWAAEVPPIVLVIDEAAELTGSGERKRDDRAGVTLRRIAARGRAAGVTLLLSTQKPSSDVIPTGVRDLLRYRWAMRCGTRAASVTVLGEAALEEGAAPHAIPVEARGVGFLTEETGGTVRCRSWFLDRSTITRCCEVADGRRLRQSAAGQLVAWPPPGGTPAPTPDGPPT